MKLRIFKKPDGTIYSSCPLGDFQNKPNFEGCKFPDFTKGLEYVDIDESELPPQNQDGGNYFEQIHFDGPCKKENIKQDKTWEKCLMPNFLIKQKQEKYLNDQLDAELAKEAPDTVEVIRISRQKDKLKTMTDEEVYQLALDNLDRAELDKPVIRQKLQQKLNK